MGRVRKNNEDNFFFDGKKLPLENEGLCSPLSFLKTTEKPLWLAVFDGMGGEAFGEEASFIASCEAERLSSERFKFPDTLKEFYSSANEKICDSSIEHQCGLMGSTAVMLNLKGDKAYFSNIGDSPAYLFREGRAEALYEEHTDRQLLESTGSLNRKPRLTQHLGIFPEDLLIEPFMRGISLKEGDVFLLSSDGLTDMAAFREIEEVLKENLTAKETSQKLMKLALDAGGKDNVTIITVKIKEKI